MIALHSVDGRVNHLDLRATLLDDALTDALDGLLTSFRIAHDAPLAYVVAACFELRLDQDDTRATPMSLRHAESSQNRWEHESR